MKFLWKMRTRSHHLRGCSTPCQLEPTLSSPVGMLQRATCNLFIRVSGGNAGRPASQLCFCNIAIWCWHHSASQTPQGSGKNLTPSLQYALFFLYQTVLGLFVWVFFLEFSSLVAERAVLRSEACSCPCTAKHCPGKQGKGPRLLYREESTMGWAALLLVTVTSKVESNTSTHLLVDTSCA